MAAPSYGSNGTNGHVQGLRPQVINNGIKLVGEVLLPGASELLEGRVGRGAVAAGIGLAVPALSAVLLGPVAALLVGGSVSLGTRVLSFYDSLHPEDWLKHEVGGRHFKTAREELDFLCAEGAITPAEYKERKAALDGTA
jgi:hypothetical protein